MSKNYSPGQVKMFLREKNIITTIPHAPLALWYYVLSKDTRPPDYKIRFGYDNDNFEGNCVINFGDPSWTLPGYMKSDKYRMVENYLNEVTKIRVSIYEGDDPDGTNNIQVRAEKRVSTEDREMIMRHFISVMPKVLEHIKLTQKNVELIKEVDKIVKKTNASTELIAFGVEQIKSEYEEFFVRDSREQLKKCLTASHDSRILFYQDRIQEVLENAEHYMECYTKAMNEYNEYNDILEGLMRNETDDNYEMMENILFHNDSISDVSFSDGYIFYRVDAPLKLYDKTAYNNKLHFTEDINESLHSGMLTHIDDMEEKALWLKLLDEIFLDEKYYIKSANYFRLHIDGRSQLNVIRDRSITGEVLPHPHGQAFGCTGTFATQWSEALADQNIPAAVQYSIAYTSNLNWDDFTVCSRMIGELKWLYYDRKILVDKDGNEFTPAELIERIKNEEVSNEN